MDPDKYKHEVFEHDFQKNNLLKALDVVKNYIISKKLIVTGGMAIDIALRKAGSKLYSDDTVPDYDFFSPEFHKDSYNIGMLLVSEGLENVDVIRATHVNTMRVRINFYPVADVTYIPQNLYDSTPTILHNNFVVVHPHYQMIDQHRALSLPFENPPTEVIFNRWKKDLERNSLLNQFYPVDDVKNKLSKLNKINKINVSIDLLNNNALGGSAAVVYWLKKATELNFKSDDKLEIKVDKTGEIIVDIPSELNLVIYTDDIKIIDEYKTGGGHNDGEGNIDGAGYSILSDDQDDADPDDPKNTMETLLLEDMIDGGADSDPDDADSDADSDADPDDPKNTMETLLLEDMIGGADSSGADSSGAEKKSKTNHKYFNSILDKVPRRVICQFANNQIEIIDNLGQLISAFKNDDLNGNFYVVNLQAAMCYLLTLAILYNNNDALNIFIIAKKIVDWAADLYSDEKNSDRKKYLPFLPTTKTYGSMNYSEALYLMKEGAVEAMHGRPKLKGKTPENTYPTENKPVNPEFYNFDPSTSELYKSDGLPTEKFTAREFI